MAYDLDQLAQDARSARGAATSMESIISKFVDGKVQGIDYTAGQKTALKDAFVAQLAAATTAIAAVQAQVDANA